MNRNDFRGAAALALLLAGTPLWADSDHGKSKYDKHGKSHGDNQQAYDGRGDEVREVRYDEERYERGGPPPWAPAHGYRGKHQSAEYRYDDSYETRVYADNARVTTQIGLDRGTCNHETIATVLGGVAGGVIGNRSAANAENEAGATIAGVVIGAIVGNTIGRAMDNNDQLCTGQTLERVADRQTVTWRHADGEQYEVMPQRTFNRDGLFCREYTTRAVISGRRDESVQSACRNPDGRWSVMR